MNSECTTYNISIKSNTPVRHTCLPVCRRQSALMERVVGPIKQQRFLLCAMAAFVCPATILMMHWWTPALPFLKIRSGIERRFLNSTGISETQPPTSESAQVENISRVASVRFNKPVSNTEVDMFFHLFQNHTQSVVFQAILKRANIYIENATFLNDPPEGMVLEREGNTQNIGNLLVPRLIVARTTTNRNDTTQTKKVEPIDADIVSAIVNAKPNVAGIISTIVNANATLQAAILLLNVVDGEEYLVPNISFFKLRPYIVNTYVPKFLISANGLCPPEGPFILVAVPSLVGHVNSRLAIRKTWGSVAYGGQWPNTSLRHSVKLIFVFGMHENSIMASLMEESQTYGDIVLADFKDSYANLSLKMVTTLHWSATYCAHARHILKVDEDTFINVPLLLDLLEVTSGLWTNYTLGFKHFTSCPPVLRIGKWKVDEDDYPLSKFPQYLFGHSYVISGDAISALLEGYRRLPLVPNEDAYVTGILSKAMNVTRIYSPFFAQPHTRKNHVCNFFNGTAISLTFFDRQKLKSAWQMFKHATCVLPNVN